MPQPATRAAPSPGGPGRFRRALATAAASLGLTAVFAVSLVGSVVLHLDLPPTRRTARTIANRIFADLFQGKVVVGEIDRLSLHGVTLRGAEAFDPEGRRIMQASGLSADADVIAIVKSALAGGGDLQVIVPRIRLDHADLALEKGPGGGPPTIARAFLPRRPSPPPPPGARKVRVLLDRIEIGHVWAHGDVAPPGLDGELTTALAHVEVGPKGLLVHAQAEHADVRSPVPRPVHGSVSFRVHAGAKGPRMEADFDGRIGELAVRTQAQLEGNHVAARIEVPHATAGAIASLVPGPPPRIPLRVPVSALIEAHGEIPELVFKTRLDVEGGGAVTAEGSVALRSPLTADVHLGVAGVDPRAVLDVPSATPIDARAHVWLEASPGKLKFDADAQTQPFSLAGNVVPAVNAKATFSHGTLKGAVEVREQGAPLHGTFTFDPAAQDLRFDAETTVASLRGIKRVAIPVDGAAHVRVRGSLRKGALDARVSARAAGIKGPDVGVEAASVDARVTGPLASLSVDATVSGSGVESGFRDFKSVKAHAAGPILAPRVDALLEAGGGESLSVSGAVDARAKALTGVKVELRRKHGTVAGSVARVAATPGGIKLEGLSLLGEGIGALKGGLLVRGKEITGRLRGENVDLEKVVHLAGSSEGIKGLANLDIDLSSSRPGSRTGHVAVELVDGELGVLKGVSGVFTATFDGDRLRTDGLVRLISRAAPGDRESERCDGAIAQLRITGGDGRLPGPLLDPASWRRVSGRIEIAADEWNLRCLRRLVPPFVPVPGLRGKLTTRVVVERAPGARLPTVQRLFARTKGLEIDADAWQSLHTDVEVNASVDGQSGETDAKVALIDGGTLAEVALGAKLDLGALLDRPDDRLDIVREAPLHGHVSVPRRAFTAFAGLPTFITDRFPVLTGSQGQTLAGDIEVDGKLEGTLDAPRIEERVRAYHVADVMFVQRAVTGPGAASKGGSRSPAPAEEPVLGPWGMPIDGEVVTRYDGRKATVDAHVDHDGHTVLTASGELLMDVADLLEGRFKPRGSLHAALDQVPLGAVPFFADRGVTGKLSGKVAVVGIGATPTADIQLHVPRLAVGRVRYDEAEASLELREPHHTEVGDRSEGKLQLTLKGGTGGSITTSVSQDIRWRDGLVPVVDPDSAAKLELRASRFRLAVAEPFIENVVSRVDGYLDGAAHLSFRPSKKRVGATATRIGDVSLALTNGVFNLPQLGQELHGIKLTLVRDPSGKLLFKDIQAQGAKGLVTGSGSAELRGIVPKQIDLAFSIKPGEELPLSLEGAPLGEVRGETKIHMTAKDRSSFEVTVANDLHIDLSPALTRSFTVEKETDNPDISVLHAPPSEEEPEQEPVAGAPTITLDFQPLNVAVKGKLLGRIPVEGTIRGDAQKPLRVVLGGRRTRISGVVDLPRFTIGILHKEFEIEGGTVTLNPDDMEKSFINVSARWDSPDGPLYVDYAGELGQLSADKLKEKLKCRADNLPQDRCFNALLIGTDQGTAAGGGQATQGQALAAQVIASEFSTEIAGGLSTSIGTGDDGSLRPGLVYKKGASTWELSTYGAGASSATTTSAGGAAPKGQHSLLTLDWRFWRNWSLRGKVDVGSDQQTYGADVLWQYRY